MDLPEGTAATFATLGGAVVAMIETSPDTFSWQCQGCHMGSAYPDLFRTVRDGANAHAAGCRSTPLPA